MGRMHGRGKGISKSTIPYNKIKPSWVTLSPEEIIQEILFLARKGNPPSKIGNILRDVHGIGQVSFITQTKILMLLRMHGLAPSIPEDLNSLLSKCYTMRSHLSNFKQDKSAKYRLILTESKLYRLARYYKRNMALPANWKPNFS
ncbi:ribosomal protein S13 [Hamiltosporidium tvaerminnensis]|uniref:Ribosomal protein S13 n=2 Tax=Hamiltosporidium TaxID=1176354 RepID=A0A4Q9KQI9_9MICR|nr:hypothetical protein LUQ84_000107 [Hamiltosporidium tvaerminnensis]TBT96902.1 ribosomal protein S13 [Hamiltosporidium magnivora]TBT99036.1 ribosomal protein S13 [Hamiltosporidium tvaerminnensis]TBU07354.1 ribosomal protein S13 [Hamiltosporidium magnivora]TBU11945.1 ribosomal protein S13 [Hamiltosporidium tvaerminnensis]